MIHKKKYIRNENWKENNTQIYLNSDEVENRKIIFWNVPLSLNIRDFYDECNRFNIDTSSWQKVRRTGLKNANRIEIILNKGADRNLCVLKLQVIVNINATNWKVVSGRPFLQRFTKRCIQKEENIDETITNKEWKVSKNFMVKTSTETKPFKLPISNRYEVLKTLGTSNNKEWKVSKNFKIKTSSETKPFELPISNRYEVLKTLDTSDNFFCSQISLHTVNEENRKSRKQRKKGFTKKIDVARIGVFNVNGVRNKEPEIEDLIKDQNLVILGLVETIKKRSIFLGSNSLEGLRIKYPTQPRVDYPEV